MHIKHYYDQTATISLNAALLGLVPAIFFVIFGIKLKIQSSIFLMTIPFLMYSFVSFQYYLVHRRRFMEIASTEEEIIMPVTDLFECEALLLSFLPAPSLRMLLFEPKGTVVGEIRDIRFSAWRWLIPTMIDSIVSHSYGVYNAQNELINVLKMNSDSIKIYSPERKLLFVSKNKSSKKGCFIDHTGLEIMNVEGMNYWCDYAFSKKGLYYGTIKKGWMPLEWTSLFKDPNMPVITWEKRAETGDRIMMLAWAAFLFACREH